MSTRRTIKKQEDVELSEDGKTLEVLYEFDYNGNNYIDIPIEFVQQALPPHTDKKCKCTHEPPTRIIEGNIEICCECERIINNLPHPPQTDVVKAVLDWINEAESNNIWTVGTQNIKRYIETILNSLPAPSVGRKQAITQVSNFHPNFA